MSPNQTTRPASATAWVNPAKGIGILLVVVGHVTDGLVRAGVPFDRDVFRVIYDTIYSFHMPLFFFLSGLFFVRSLDKRGLPAFVAGKVDSLLYPYVVWSLVQGLIEVGMSRYTNSDAQLSDVLALAWAPRQQMWFLYALFFIFVLCALARSWLGTRWLVVAGVAAVAAFLLRRELPSMPLIAYLAGYMVFFVAGAHRHRLVEAVGMPRRRTIALALLVFVAIQLLLQSRWGTAGDLGPPIALLAAFIGIAMVVFVSRRIAASGAGVLDVLGRHSMPIFLLHTLFAAGARIGLQRFMHVENVWVHLAMGLGLGVAAPLVIGVLAERWHIGGLFESPRRLRLEPRWSRLRPESQSIP